MPELLIPYDQFELERPMQPKHDVASYVESCGIPTPIHTDSFDDALEMLANNIPVSVRSENPDEYGGPSGLGTSTHVVPGLNAAQTLTRLTETPDYDALRRYALANGIDPTAYTKDCSVTYWEYIPGTNVTVVADDVIPGQYHIFGHAVNKDLEGPTYLKVGAIVNETTGLITKSDNSGTTNDRDMLDDYYERLIERYEEIRTLDKFKSDHCPIIEMQISDADDEIYFLQYHRSRDTAPAVQPLDPNDYDPRNHWFKADGVRGAYLGGTALRFAIHYNMQNTTTNGLYVPEDGYFGKDPVSEVISEHRARTRLVDVTPRSFSTVYKRAANGHSQRSRIFKPQASLFLSMEIADAIVSPRLREQARELSEREGATVGIEAEVVSDGRIGFIRSNAISGNDLLVMSAR